MEEIRKKVIEWAKDKDLIKPKNAKKQALKMISEIGEVADALCKEDKEALKIEIGDVLVTLIILAEQLSIKNSFALDEEIQLYDSDFICDLIENANDILYFVYIEEEHPVSNYIDLTLNHLDSVSYNNGLELNDCLKAAYNKISTRKGKTVNGTFIKD